MQLAKMPVSKAQVTVKQYTHWCFTMNGRKAMMKQMFKCRVVSAARHRIAQLIVSIILQYTVDLDFIMLAVDNASMVDELSWEVIAIWFTHACNLFLVGTSEALTPRDFNMPTTFSDYLFNEGFVDNQFLHIDLPPLRLGDIEKLIHCLHRNDNEERTCSGKISQTKSIYSLVAMPGWQSTSSKGLILKNRPTGERASRD
jgi:hypothetical protein